MNLIEKKKERKHYLLCKLVKKICMRFKTGKIIKKAINIIF